MLAFGDQPPAHLPHELTQGFIGEVMQVLVRLPVAPVREPFQSWEERQGYDQGFRLQILDEF